MIINLDKSYLETIALCLMNYRYKDVSYIIARIKECIELGRDLDLDESEWMFILDKLADYPYMWVHGIIEKIGMKLRERNS